MGLETSTTIDGLNVSWPVTSDPRSITDDNLRMLKDVLKKIFPGSGGNGFSIPIAATEDEINYLSGVTSAVQTQLNEKAPLASPVLTGTPTVPTPSTGNNSQQIPNTAWVNNAISTNTPALRLAAKAWLKVDAAGNILDSYGIASVVDTGTGIVTVNFSTPFTGINNFSCVVGVDAASGMGIRVAVSSVSQIILHCEKTNLLATYDHVDPSAYHLAVFGDQ